MWLFIIASIILGGIFFYGWGVNDQRTIWYKRINTGVPVELRDKAVWLISSKEYLEFMKYTAKKKESEEEPKNDYT